MLEHVKDAPQFLIIARKSKQKRVNMEENILNNLLQD